MGATLPWCGFNVHVAKGMLVEAAAQAYAAVGEVIPSDVPGLTALGVRQPVVVVVGIAPWNAAAHPGRTVHRVAAGVGRHRGAEVPSEQTPLTQASIVQVLHDAGVPAGAVNLISNAPEDGPSVVEALIAHCAVTRVQCTGSSRVGRIIGELGGRHLTRVGLELGGKAPFLVLPDADLEEAAAPAGLGAFMNQGELRPSARRWERHGWTPARQRPPSGSTESWRSSSGPSDEAPDTRDLHPSEESTMSQADDDRHEIRRLIENWALWRDAGDWGRFATVWHPRDGRMSATWFQGSATDFIKASREGFENGVSILHFLGGHTADIVGDRAVAQTKMTINQRASVDGVEVDVVCTGRFYDFLARHEGRWTLVRRQPIYEKDRLDVVDPAASLTLDPDLLNRFPTGYRHLGYLQTKAGFTVKDGLPGLTGTAVEQLYGEGRQWLVEAR